MISPGGKQQTIRPTGIFLKYRGVNARNVGLGLQLDRCDGKLCANLFQFPSICCCCLRGFNFDRLFELLGDERRLVIFATARFVLSLAVWLIP